MDEAPLGETYERRIQTHTYDEDPISQAASKLKDVVLDGVLSCEEAITHIRSKDNRHFGGPEGRKQMLAIWEARVHHLIALGNSLRDGVAPGQ